MRERVFDSHIFLFLLCICVLNGEDDADAIFGNNGTESDDVCMLIKVNIEDGDYDV